MQDLDLDLFQVLSIIQEASVSVVIIIQPNENGARRVLAVAKSGHGRI